MVLMSGSIFSGFCHGNHSQDDVIKRGVRANVNAQPQAGQQMINGQHECSIANVARRTLCVAATLVKKLSRDELLKLFKQSTTPQLHHDDLGRSFNMLRAALRRRGLLDYAGHRTRS